jgi:hypothetical protein
MRSSLCLLLFAISLAAQPVGPVVKGNPYSARVAGVSVDGAYTGMQYRDSEGRTRSDNAIQADGLPLSITISDPVAGVQYYLDPENKLAVKRFLPWRFTDAALKEESIPKTKVEPVMMHSSGNAVTLITNLSSTQEDLGSRRMQGVEATGTRYTEVNSVMGKTETIVHERWFSPVLKLNLMYAQMWGQGTNAWGLTAIDRSEPRASLFLVPPDYTIKDLTH